MNGIELRKELAKRCGTSRRQAAAFIEAFTGILSEELERGGTVTIRGFGRFHTVRCNRREVVSPRGERIPLEPRELARFTASPVLRKRVSGKLIQEEK